MTDPDVKLIEAGSGQSRWRAGARLAGILLVRIAFDALVLDAAIETWLSPSPIRVGVAVATAVYFGLTVWVLSKGGRIGGPGWLTDPAMPIVVLLGFAIAATWTPETAVVGIVMLKQPTPVVLSGTTLFVAVLATFRLAGPPGLRSWWGKSAVVAVGAYAAVALVLAVRARTPYAALLAGDSLWRSLPVALRGGYAGAFVLPVAGFAHELATSLVRLTLRGLVRWMFIFALAAWMALNLAH